MKGQKHLTIVIKLGTSSIVDEQTHEPLLPVLSIIVATAVKLRKNGNRVVLVSSGAIGVALGKMDLEKRPKHLPQVQALAAIGQCKLVSLWDTLFGQLRQPIAQILLTRNDIADRTQYLNAQNTFSELLDMGVIPIVNENDTIAVTEINFGDNDTLSAITAAMVSADYLFLMTDVDCLYTTNPRKDSNATPVLVVSDISSLAVNVSSRGSALGTGGMSTKIVAARLATSAGVTTIITKSSKPGNVLDIVNYLEALKTQTTSHSAIQSDVTGSFVSPVPPYFPEPPLHTRFLPSSSPIRDRSFWLLHGLAPHGIIFIDEGAHRALLNKAGLLPVGVVDVEGNFAQQEAVRLVVARRLHPLPNHRKRMSAQETFKSIDSDTSEPLTPTAPGTPQEALAAGGLSGYSAALDLSSAGAAMDHSSSSTAISSSAVTPSTSMSASTSSLAAVQTTGSSPLFAVSPAPWEVGRALVNYSSAEISRIKGLQSSEISDALGYADSEYVALRENVSLVKSGSSAEGGREGEGERGERQEQRDDMRE